MGTLSSSFYFFYKPLFYLIYLQTVPFLCIAALVHGRRVIAGLYSSVAVGVGQCRWRGGGCTQESIQTVTAVLEHGFFLILLEDFDPHWLENLWVHEGLTKTHGLEAGNRLVTEETVGTDVGQHHIHSLWAQKAVLVGLQVVAPLLHLHLGVQVGNDAGPNKGGSEWFSCHVLFWCEERGDDQRLTGELSIIFRPLR